MTAPVNAVPSSVSTSPDGIWKQRWPLAAAAATYYPGEMIAKDVAGNAIKAADTVGAIFVGIQANSVRIVVPAGGSAGDFEVDVELPPAFEILLTAVDRGDIGAPAYAAFSNEAALSSTNGVYLGTIIDVVAANVALIRPPPSFEYTKPPEFI